MSAKQEQQTELLQRLARAGYVITEEETHTDGVARRLIGKQWMTFAEMSALASQDSEQQEKE